YFREGLTLREIGEQVGTSESRVSQMTSAIMKRLRSRSDSVARPTLASLKGTARSRKPAKGSVAAVRAVRARRPKPCRPRGRRDERQHIATYVTADEKAQLVAEAGKAGLSLSAWMKVTLLAALKRSA